MFIITSILVLLLSYLIGSIMSGDLVARIKKVDLRSRGSGNVGATNVFRTMGTSYGIIVLVADALKGVIAVLLGVWVNTYFGYSSELPICSGILAIMGHNWPIYAKFKGGKGIATSLGVIIALSPQSLLVALPVWLLAFFISGYVSVGSILAAIAYPVSVFIFYPNQLYLQIFALVAGGLAVYRHRVNIQRLLHGEENRILYKKQKEGRE